MKDSAERASMPDSDTRQKRYLAKITHATDRMQLVDRSLAEAGAEADQKTVLAISKAAQEVVELRLDLVAMMLRDSGRPPQDDYTNIDQARQTGILSPATRSRVHQASE
jgi:uncharacterized protein YutE (UPF0331/DUF86 family)